MRKILWSLIPEPTVADGLLVALDDSINNKTGRKVFGCGFFHDHTAELNQPAYPWAQNIVSIGLLKVVKGRWCCLPLAFRFYLLQKDIDAQSIAARRCGKTVAFQSKLSQAAEMLQAVAAHFMATPILVVTDSWFGNDGLFRPLSQSRGTFDLLSRLRANTTLYDLPSNCPRPKHAGRSRKYGARLGGASDLASRGREPARGVSVFLYGKSRTVDAYEQFVVLKNLRCQVRVVWVFRKTRWVALFSTDLALSVQEIIEYYGARWKIESGFKEIKQEIGSSESLTRNADAVTNHLLFCMMATTITWICADRIQTEPDRRHSVNGRSSFAFSDIRRLIANAALDPDFLRLWPDLHIPRHNSFVAVLLRMVA